MSDPDRRPTDLHTPVVPPATASASSSLPWIVASLLVLVLAVGYLAIGTPILKAPDEARAPSKHAIHAPDPAAPAESRP